MSVQSNTLPCLFLLLTVASAVNGQPACATDVYIVAGQSNGWRISSVTNIPNGADQRNIIYFPMMCTTAPDKATLQVVKSVHPSSQGRTLAEGLLKHSDDNIIIVQYCVCGSNLHSKAGWHPGDDLATEPIDDNGLFSRFVNYVADARQQAEAAGHEWNVKAVFWHQGEADSNARASAYEDNFRRLVLRLRKELKADLPVIAGHIRPLSESAREVNRGLDAVAKADQLVVVVSTADLTPELPSDVHFNTAGCHELGRRMVEAYSALATRTTTSKANDGSSH